MNMEQLKRLAKRKLTAQQLLLIRCLHEHGGTAYVQDIVSETGLRRDQIDGILRKQREMFDRVKLCEKPNGIGRAQTLGLKLRIAGQDVMDIMTEVA